jgi:hypothetical protein
MIYPTELRAQRGGDTDIRILEKFSLPMSMIGQSTDTFLGAGEGLQVFENIAQWREHHLSVRGLENADAGFMDANAAEVDESFSRGYVVAEQVTITNSYKIQLRPLSQYDAESSYSLADQLLFKDKAAASVDMRRRHMGEETPVDIRPYSWHGMDFRQRPMTLLTPTLLNFWSALPYCCFSFEGIVNDNAFPADDFESFFTQLHEEDMMIHNEDITFAKKNKGGNMGYTCNREPSSKGVGKDKLDIPRPCNYKDFPRFMVRKTHRWSALLACGLRHRAELYDFAGDRVDARGFVRVCACARMCVCACARVRVCACARVRVCVCARVRVCRVSCQIM